MNNKLIELLKEWFENTDFSKPNLWTRDKVASLIKKELIGLSHWKNLSNGKSAARKGLEAMKRKKAIENGWTPPDESDEMPW